MNVVKAARSALLAALFVAPSLVFASQMPPRATMFARWESANRTTVAKIHSPKSRLASERALSATLLRIRTSGPTISPAAAPRALAAAELAFPGRYDLRDANAAPPAKTLWERFWEWAGSQWNRLMDALFGHGKSGSAGSAALGELLIAAVGILLVVTIFRFLVVLQIDRARRGNAFTPLEHQKNAHALYLQACALAQNGAYEAAVQRLFLAAVTALDLRGVLHDDASATVGDMRRVLRGRNAALLSPFDGVAAAFVDAIYAETPIAATQWMQAKDAYGRLTASEATS
ncbi:MAG TPA: hypothetical protein VMS32_02980 [Verrucomicrobiae bacterium]|nr:hypothetical protein [Verrucomicrobiae bacterium]